MQAKHHLYIDLNDPALVVDAFVPRPVVRRRIILQQVALLARPRPAPFVCT
jgi:hypothetical protein